jgi:flagellar basal body P-ring formation protein FlgA
LGSFAQNCKEVAFMTVKRVIFLLSAASVFCAAQSLAASAQLDAPRLRVEAAAWLEQQAMMAFPGSSAKASVGDIDARLRLPACADTRFFLPANATLWGSGSLGVRCDAPSPWSFYLSYRNRLSGPALVATRPIAAREQPSGADLELRLIEYAQSPDLYPRSLPANARVNRPIPAGQAIPISWLSLATVIKAGRQVRLVARAVGFQVTQEGVALNSAAPGERVKVKTPSGRIVQGIAQQDGTVSVNP